MAKGKASSAFFCQNCGYEASKWMGQCPACRTWNCFVEERITVKSSPAAGSAKAVSSGFAYLVEFYSNGTVGGNAQNIGNVPRNSFAFSVRVGGEQYFVGFGYRAF